MDASKKLWKALAIMFFTSFCIILFAVSQLLSINDSLIEMNTELLNTIENMDNGVRIEYLIPDATQEKQITIESHIV